MNALLGLALAVAVYAAIVACVLFPVLPLAFVALMLCASIGRDIRHRMTPIPATERR